MKWKMTGADVDARVFPTVGKVRIAVPVEQGRPREIEMSFAQADRLTRVMLDLVATNAELAAQAGHLFPLDTAELQSEMPAAGPFRVTALGPAGRIGIQVAVPGKGLVGFSMTEAETRNMAAHLQSQLVELQASRRAPS